MKAKSKVWNRQQMRAGAAKRARTSYSLYSNGTKFAWAAKGAGGMVTIGW